MRFGKYLSALTKPELEELEEKCNFSDDERIIFNMLSKNKSLIEIGDRQMISLSTVKRKILNMKKKVEKINGEGH